MRLQTAVLWAMVAVYPLVVVPSTTDYLSLPRWVVLAALSTAGIGFLLIRRQPLRPDRSFLPLAVFVALLAVSALLSPYPFESWVGTYKRYMGFSTHLFCVFLFILALYTVQRVSDFRHLVRCWLYSAAVVAVIGLGQYFNIDPVIWSQLDFGARSYGTIGNPNFLATYALLALPFAVVLFMTDRRARWAIIATLLFAVLLTSFTRGVWLAALPVLAALGYLFRTEYKRYLIVTVCFAAALLALMPAHDWLLYKRIASVPVQTSMALEGDPMGGTARVFIWQETLKVIPDQWLFGSGPDTLKYVVKPTGEQTQLIWGREVTIDKAHNTYLELAATVGIPAVLAYLWFLAHFVHFNPRSPYQCACFAAVGGYLAQGFVNIDVIHVYPLFWIVLGMTLALRRIDHRGAMPDRQGRREFDGAKRAPFQPQSEPPPGGTPLLKPSLFHE